MGLDHDYFCMGVDHDLKMGEYDAFYTA